MHHLENVTFMLSCMLVLALTACQQAVLSNAEQNKNHSAQEKVQLTTGNTARPGNVAVRQEYEAAQKANTIKAWELFIARHPDSPWTSNAKTKLQQLLSKNG
jgi:hypothetical protein